ncbi:uncharacterized protein LOC111263946 [Varroa jacobsoni]|uniref:Uncharacterized protein n=1 Tax=Varroa destructor TaxID=109461 RepID=A0A7M7K2Y2_VARDE|nr:uncharacterized protein LOC111249875 isoform X1 [Varroa destructor]XP_022695214.1 uncharacterized protein LOC111263946 [Varroa jacobsoni]
MHHHWDLKLARERLCKEAKLRICNMTFTPNSLGFSHSPNYKTFHYPRIDQSIDAVIYVTVVFILFAAIVLLLVGTGCHRYQPVSGQGGKLGEKRQLVVRFEDGGASQTSPEVPMEPV